MAVMIVGLLIFLGTHSVHILAGNWRARQIQRLGEGPWKALFSVVSVIGLAIAIWGYGQMRLDPIWLWHPPVGLRHLVALLMIPAFVLLVAAFVPRNVLRTRLGHPMLLAVKVWALAHLLVNGRLGDIVFFGAFLVWAVLAFRAARQRDRTMATTPAQATTRGTVLAVVLGLAAFYVFAFHLHVWVTGVPAFA